MKKNRCSDCNSRLIRHTTLGLCCPQWGCSMFKKPIDKEGV